VLFSSVARTVFESDHRHGKRSDYQKSEELIKDDPLCSFYFSVFFVEVFSVRCSFCDFFDVRSDFFDLWLLRLSFSAFRNVL
jgi:hypothetical protein